MQPSFIYKSYKVKCNQLQLYVSIQGAALGVSLLPMAEIDSIISGTLIHLQLGSLDVRMHWHVFMGINTHRCPHSL